MTAKNSSLKLIFTSSFIANDKIEKYMKGEKITIENSFSYIYDDYKDKMLNKINLRLLKKLYFIYMDISSILTISFDEMLMSDDFYRELAYKIYNFTIRFDIIDFLLECLKPSNNENKKHVNMKNVYGKNSENVSLMGKYTIIEEHLQCDLEENTMNDFYEYITSLLYNENYNKDLPVTKISARVRNNIISASHKQYNETSMKINDKDYSLLKLEGFRLYDGIKNSIENSEKGEYTIVWGH